LEGSWHYLSLDYNPIPEPQVATPNEAAYNKLPRKVFWGQVALVEAVRTAVDSQIRQVTQEALNNANAQHRRAVVFDLNTENLRFTIHG